jgi:hypothetical protein
VTRCFSMAFVTNLKSFVGVVIIIIMRLEVLIVCNFQKRSYQKDTLVDKVVLSISLSQM